MALSFIIGSGNELPFGEEKGNNKSAAQDTGKNIESTAHSINSRFSRYPF